VQNLFSDPFTLVIIAVLIVLIFFMFRNGRKRRQQMQELQAKVIPGAEVITQSGIIGTIIHMDDEAGKVELETTPGTVITVHRQTVTNVLTPAIPDSAEELTSADLPGDDRIADSTAPGAERTSAVDGSEGGSPEDGDTPASSEGPTDKPEK